MIEIKLIRICAPHQCVIISLIRTNKGMWIAVELIYTFIRIRVSGCVDVIRELQKKKKKQII